MDIEKTKREIKRILKSTYSEKGFEYCYEIDIVENNGLNIRIVNQNFKTIIGKVKNIIDLYNFLGEVQEILKKEDDGNMIEKTFNLIK